MEAKSVTTTEKIYINKKINDFLQSISYSIYMIPGSKGLYPLELAHKWVIDLVTRQNRSIEVGR